MNRGRLVFGSVMFAIGALFLLDFADVLDAGRTIAMWWPAVLIAIGLLALSANTRHWVMPAVTIGFGTVLLLRTTEVIDSLQVAGPLFLVVLGLLVIFGRGFTNRTGGTQDRVNSFNVFSGSEIAPRSDHFEGGSIGALFGGAEVDLRNAKPVPGAELDVFIAFGGAEIKVPEGWHVTTHGMPIFGGFENVTVSEPFVEGAPTLDINATVIFGGIEVKH